jgi:hypothetical protein
MLCINVKRLTFLLLHELSNVQQQLIRGLSFGETYYWSPGGDTEHYYYYIYTMTLPASQTQSIRDAICAPPSTPQSQVLQNGRR